MTRLLIFLDLLAGRLIFWWAMRQIRRHRRRALKLKLGREIMIKPFGKRIPAFLGRREPITLPQDTQRSFLGRLWHRLVLVLPHLWSEHSPPLRSWQTGRYLVIELEDDAP